jgi:hypothetical protein
MINEEAIRRAIVMHPAQFGLSRPLHLDDVHIAIRVPEFESTTGRIRYWVFVRDSRLPALIAQSAPVSGRSLVGRNPYVPDNVDRALLADVLPLPSGELTNGSRRICWAKYIPWQPLCEIADGDSSALTDVITRLRQPPWTTPAGDSGEALAWYVAQAQQVCAFLDELRPQAAELVAILSREWSRLALGFSHGDLWNRDILRSSDGRLCILDWEWAAPARPMGTDLFDLAISTLETRLRLPTDEAIACMAFGGEQTETLLRGELIRLWDDLGYDVVARRTSLFTYLIHLQSRIAMRASHALPDAQLGAARAMATAYHSPTHFLSLFDSKRIPAADHPHTGQPVRQP